MKKPITYTMLLLQILLLGCISSCKDNDAEETNIIPQTVTLIYDINGATEGSTPDSIKMTGGTTITLDRGSNLWREGYQLTGWNTNTEGTGIHYPIGSVYKLSNNIILYAEWRNISANNTLRITINSYVFRARLVDNNTIEAFKQILPMTVNMSELNNNEKYCSLSTTLPTNTFSPNIINNGDLMLYGTNTLVLFYKTFSTTYSYTRIGYVDNPAKLENILGKGNVIVKFEIE